MNHCMCCLLRIYLIIFCSTGILSSHDHNLVANYSGDIILGAVFPIHHRNGLNCGKLQLEEGIQALEALVFTINKINKNETLLPGIKLGIVAIDSCDNEVHALEQSLDFIKGFMTRGQQFQKGNFVCANGDKPVYASGRFDNIVGVIGGQSSAVSIQLAQLLRLFHVPQVNLKIVSKFGWKYAAVVYSDSDYGNRGFETLVDLAPDYDVCFSLPIRVSLDRFNSQDYDFVVRTLLYKTKAKVVIVFANKQITKKLMEAVKRYNSYDRFVWIGSDAWGGRQSVVERNEDVIEGAISVQPLVRPIQGFSEYLTNLNDKNNKANPWFAEFWEEYFKCEIQGLRDSGNRTKYKWCNGKEKLAKENGFTQQPSLHFVRDAAYAFAFALHSLHKSKCKGQSGLCPELMPINGEELKSNLQKVSFQDEAGNVFKFLESGDGPPRYSIMNFQKVKNDSYEWKLVGTYSRETNLPELHLNVNEVKFKHNHPEFPRSYCSEPCAIGQAKIQLEGDICCWVSVCKIFINLSAFYYKIGGFFVLRDTQIPFLCYCPNGTRPDEDRVLCMEIPVEHVGYEHPWAIGTMSFAGHNREQLIGLGICITIMITIIFWVYGETPIIKAAGRELSYLLLFGIFLSFALTFIIVAKPSPWTCGLTRFFLGFCYTLCYAAMVTKVNRIARIFNQQTGLHKTKYTSPQSQLVITTVLVSVEIIVNGTWLIYNNPKVTYTYPKRNKNVLICTGSEDASYLVGLIYPFILICFCTVFAFKVRLQLYSFHLIRLLCPFKFKISSVTKSDLRNRFYGFISSTRKCPEGFNEARHVTFTNYTTFVIWLAFVPLFFLSHSNHIRVVTLSFALSLGGFVQLACLFIPKIYVAVLKPEKNTRENVMYSHHSMHSSSLGVQPGISNGVSQISYQIGTNYISFISHNIFKTFKIIKKTTYRFNFHLNIFICDQTTQFVALVYSIDYNNPRIFYSFSSSVFCLERDKRIYITLFHRINLVFSILFLLHTFNIN
ncbi:Metabotropic glutamate receptor 8 [Nymphon striatum]|nr:Metabotropic glutamate receptor 8 [Nymphon striatum]